jgi:two-component system, chemotaxis family, chemotaxis protein CheY
MNEGTTIMIVDDNEAMRILIRQMLETEGYQHFVEVEDGVSAYEILKTQKIDLVLSDWNMAGMTGIELLSKIRGDRDIAQTPFIMLSVEGLDVSMDQAFKSGANDFVSKPFLVNELTDSVSRVMKQTT